jgi:hypothetical protein
MLDSIITTIEKKRPDLNRQEVRSIATDIYYSGEDPSTILASSGTLDRLISGYKSRLAAASQSVAANDPTICPICKVALKPVKLANERKAVYCSKHFVVFPIKPENKES